MVGFFKKIFTYRAMAIMLFVYALAMALATVIEAKIGTPAAKALVYHNVVFVLLQVLLAVNFAGIAVRQQLYKQRKWGTLIVHWGFVVVLFGALVTHLFSSESVMHIREGETSGVGLVGQKQIELPFTIELKDFTVDRYSGSHSPSSFESDVVIRHKGEVYEQKIYMNNIAYIGGYRVYQTSYDTDEQGTILTVNHDMVGTVISYFGYLMLTIGFVLSLLHRNSRFRTLARMLSSSAALFFLCLSSTAANYTPSEVLQRSVISPTVATELSTLLVQNPNGRTEPISTYASKLMRKLHRAESFEGIDAQQAIMGMITNPYLWSNAQVIYVPGKDLVERFGGKKYISYNDLFDAQTGSYILDGEVNDVFAKSAKDQSRQDKDILKLDEKINIMHSLFQGVMFNIFPSKESATNHWYSSGDDLSVFKGRDSLFVNNVMPWFSSEVEASLSSGDWKTPLEIVSMVRTYQKSMAHEEDLIPERKINAEVLYNKLNIFKVSGIVYLSAAFLLLIVLFSALLKGRRANGIWVKVFALIIIVIFLYHTFGIALRWYISGRAPWTNAYESMVYVSWSAVLAGLIFMRRSIITLAVATLLGGIVLMISQLNFMDPEITPLVPVLKSYWLMFHVAIITASYGFFGMSALLGLMAFGVMISGNEHLGKKVKEMTIINEMSIIIGLALLTIGVFFGAVWANESWGRYWGWDPKETWALISMIVYAFIIHARFVDGLRGTYIFNAMSVFGFYSILMTFFGVNYYLSGMHSYGSSSSLSSSLVVYVTLFIIFVAVLAYYRGKKKKI